MADAETGEPSAPAASIAPGSPGGVPTTEHPRRPAGANRWLDRPTFGAAWQVLLLCWFLYSLGPLVLQIREAFDLSHAQAGAHSSMVLLGGLTAGLTSAAVVRRIGRDRTRRAGMALLALGATAIAVAPGLWLTLTGAYLCGWGISTTVNALNPSIVDHHGEASAGVLTLLNAAGATLGALAPLALAAAISVGVDWRIQVVAVSALALMLVLLTRTPFPSRAGSPSQQLRVDSRQRHGLLFALIVAALALAQLIEFSTGIYAVDILHNKGALTTADASAYAAAFIGGFALGRWLTIVVASRFTPLAIGLVAACTASAGAAWVATASPAMSIAAGLFVVGVGNGPGYPLLVSAALRATKADRDRASATIAIVGGGCAAVAPTALGVLADHAGLSAVFISLSGTAAVSAGFLLYALFYDRANGGSVPTQRSVGV